MELEKFSERSELGAGDTVKNSNTVAIANPGQADSELKEESKLDNDER